MLTARGLKADKREGLTAGAADYLTKPFHNEELVTRVRGVLRRARYLRSQSPLTGLPGNLRTHVPEPSRDSHDGLHLRG